MHDKDNCRLLIISGWNLRFQIYMFEAKHFFCKVGMIIFSGLSDLNMVIKQG